LRHRAAIASNTPVTPGAPCLFPITAAVNLGTTTPGASGYTDHVANINVGTSFSAPLVAGAAALLHGVNAQLTPPQYIALLKDSASPFCDQQLDNDDRLPRARWRHAGPRNASARRKPAAREC
jgi:hypothetical protein